MQILPAPELLPFIRHYLFIDGTEEAFNKLRMFPDGSPGMVVSTKASLVAGSIGPPESLPSSFIYGQISAFRDLLWIGSGCLAIVVFRPAGIRQLIGVSANELRGNIIRTEDLFGGDVVTLPERLAEKDCCKSKAAALNTFFAQLGRPQKLSSDGWIEATVDFISQKKGMATVTQLTKYTGYTERHIERIFGECIGLGPKELCNIVRLHNFIKFTKRNAGRQNLAAISYEAGYSDQSHLIRDFKRYTGLTPKEYVKNPNKLAVNFVGI